jgi:hypothetical protein
MTYPPEVISYVQERVDYAAHYLYSPDTGRIIYCSGASPGESRSHTDNPRFCPWLTERDYPGHVLLLAEDVLRQPLTTHSSWRDQ